MIRLFQIVAAVAMVAAGPAGQVRHSPDGAHKPRTVAAVQREPEVPGIVLIGMAVAGLAIVGASARRRQPGRSVPN